MIHNLDIRYADYFRIGDALYLFLFIAITYKPWLLGTNFAPMKVRREINGSAWKQEVEMKKALHIALTILIGLALLFVGYIYYCGSKGSYPCSARYETGLSFSR